MTLPPYFHYSELNLTMKVRSLVKSYWTIFKLLIINFLRNENHINLLWMDCHWSRSSTVPKTLINVDCPSCYIHSRKFNSTENKMLMQAAFLNVDHPNVVSNLSTKAFEPCTLFL